MEMRCYRKILHISYKDHVTNEKVHAKIQQAIGPHENLLMIVKRCKLQWYGHVSHSSGLAKTILQGTVKGGRRQLLPVGGCIMCAIECYQQFSITGQLCLARGRTRSRKKGKSFWLC